MKSTTTRRISLEAVIDFYGNQSEIGIGVVTTIAGASLKLLLGANLTQSA